MVTIAMPCLDEERFIEACVRSVLAQDYPRIEYLVMDGGSTDGTRQILERYRPRLEFVSERDHGQSDAVNRGFARTSGSIFAFLNADDTYLPGAIAAAVQALDEHADADLVYGEAWYVDEHDARIAPYPVEAFARERLNRRCVICQPAAFFRREAFAAAGMLNPELRFAHDYDLWIRMLQRSEAIKIDRYLATLRIHAGAKTVRDTAPAMLEAIEVLRRHFGYVPWNWIYGYGHHRLTGDPVAVSKPRPALMSACYAAALGARWNWRHPLRYCLDIVESGRRTFA
jgi:glycosyltransferase involved in cell wall biosynthesis